MVRFAKPSAIFSKIKLILPPKPRQTQPATYSGDPAIDKPQYPESPAVTAIAEAVSSRLDRETREAALRYAMEASAELLRTPTDAVRFDLRERVFKPFSMRGVSYQDSDFECVDYEQYELAPDLPLFRGPPVSAAALEHGNYFCVIGAAQTFGRLVRDPWPSLMSRTLDLPVLNLSGGGVGPEFFLEPRLIALARKARFVILQVMSGRSVGCEEYPGGRLVTRDSKTTKLNRLDLLETMWNEDPEIALKYIRRWNQNYLALYRKLYQAIGRPTVLLWVSDRRPGGWMPGVVKKRPRWGSFPHLVGRKLYYKIANFCDEHYEFLTGPISEAPVSRISGDPCPYFGDGGKKLHTQQIYYPTSTNHARLAEGLTPWAEGVLQSSAGSASASASA